MAQSTEKGLLYNFLIKEDSAQHPRLITRRKLLIAGGITAAGLIAEPVIHYVDKIVGAKSDQVKPTKPQEDTETTQAEFKQNATVLLRNPRFSEYQTKLIDGQNIPIPTGWTAHPNNQWAEFFPSADPKDPNMLSVKRGISDAPAWVSDSFTLDPNSVHLLTFSTMVHNFREMPSEIKPLIIFQALDSKNGLIDAFPVDCPDLESNAIRTFDINIPRQQWPQGTRKARIQLTYEEIKDAEKTNLGQKIFYYEVTLTPKASA